MKTALKVIGFFLLFCVVLAMFSDDKETEAKAIDTNTSKKVSAPVSSWRQYENIDEMTDKKTYHNTTTSTNSVDFEFPYNGGSEFTLTVMKGEGSNDVLLQVSKGQFMLDFSGEKTVRFKFDDKPAKSYSYTGTSDGRPDAIFITNPKSIIANLRKAKTLKVDAEFFKEGRRVMEFDVSGFKWEH